jgi:hypothetical protein
MLAPAVAVNVAVVAADATVTDAGMVRRGLSLARVTVTPPAGAAELNVTAQVEPAPGFKLSGLHTTEEMGDAETEMIPLVPFVVVSSLPSPSTPMELSMATVVAPATGARVT